MHAYLHTCVPEALLLNVRRIVHNLRVGCSTIARQILLAAAACIHAHKHEEPREKEGDAYTNSHWKQVFAESCVLHRHLLVCVYVCMYACIS
jgi:hypothetical protein